MITETVSRVPGLALVDHRFELPLDYDRPDGPAISVFAREVVAAERLGHDLPWLVFFQGGPGGAAPRPATRTGWLARAVRDYRVLLLDQRGTGLSTPATRQTLAHVGGPAAQAAYATRFRADAIVDDAEVIRRRLTGGAPWSVLGQSFGGFCLLRYLSVAPEGVREAFFTGGLPPLYASAEDVYRATYRRVIARNAAFNARYPGDSSVSRRIADHLNKHEVHLPDGSPLTVPRFQQLGVGLGATSGYAQLHYLLEGAFVETRAGTELSDSFLAGVHRSVSFAEAPLYALLHEACYAQGEATLWAAERVRAEYPEFSPDALRLLFTGEMIFPWMFDLDPALVPLRDAAQLLAEHRHWPRLYDEDALRGCRVPAAAAIYADDMYVECEFSEATAAVLPGLRVWLTNEYEHDGLRTSDEMVFDRLVAMVRGMV